MNPSASLLLITHYFPAHRGGVELVAGELAKRLARQGHRITWMASAVDEPPVSQGVQCIPVPSWNGLERHGLPWPVWSLGGFLRLEQEVHRCDLVHVHDFIYLPCLIAFLLAKIHRRPVVITQHIGDIPYRNPLLRWTQWVVNRTLGVCLLSRSDRTIFISDLIRSQFQRCCRFVHPPEYWPNGVDITLFHAIPDFQRRQIRSSLGIGDNDRLLLFVGRFVEKKGLRVLSRMARETSSWKWWFAGWGSEGSGLHPSTWHLPNVTVFQDRRGGGLADLYRAADLLVLPSQGEGFPLVVQEAMACGTPALVGEETAKGAPAARDLLFWESLNANIDISTVWIQRINDILEPVPLTYNRHATSEWATKFWNWERITTLYDGLFRRLLEG